MYKNAFYTHGILVLFEIGYLLERFNGLVYFSMYKIMRVDSICVVLNMDSNKSILNVLILVQNRSFMTRIGHFITFLFIHFVYML
ncbi:TPA_asm: hypothetical protein GDN21_03400 [Listeria monocytogenes]|nr:hypothetical protein [Listeria monocytogenes]EAG0820941.1 hypothetical protein [Listeria monocytogenes]HAA0684967.1 hypothetical protein [Listeria monocytogenes]